MDKDEERGFLEMFARGLLSLPYDVKALVDAVADPDLDPSAQELAAATVIHVLTPKDAHFEPILRHAEDVVLVRLALRRIASEGGGDAASFKERFSDRYQTLDQEISGLTAALGPKLIEWLDGRWDSLKKTPHAKKTAKQYVQDPDLASKLYDEVLEFETDYPVTERSLEGRLKQAQPLIDHLVRKHDQDRMKIGH